MALLRVDQEASRSALVAPMERLRPAKLLLQPSCSAQHRGGPSGQPGICLGERAASVPVTAFLMAAPGHPNLFKSFADSSPSPFGIHNSQGLDIDVF